MPLELEGQSMLRCYQQQAPNLHIKHGEKM
jgi:hypothetical protein